MAAVVAVALSGFVPVAAEASTAINKVECGRNDFLRLTVHRTNSANFDICFANAGEYGFYEEHWVTRISTGNNRVQWLGDGYWQPNSPIAKWTVFGYPNHPGGVRINKIKIL